VAKVKNPLAVGNTGRGRASRRGGGSYDNPRENIDPHVKTHVLNTVEVLSNKIKLRDGTGAGFVKNDVNGVLSGGNTGGGGGSGSMTTVKEGGVQLGGADIVTLDFNGDDFNLTESPDTEVNVTVNDGGIDHDSLLNFASNEHFTEGSIDHTAITNIGSNTHAQIDTAVTASTNHIADNSQAHSDYLINNGDDTTSGKITANNMEIVGDNNTNDTSYMGMVLHGTDSSPPTASNYPHGTIYLQYAA
jgi:hypothetical protein